MEGIEKEWEMWQNELEKRQLHLKLTVKFDMDKIEEILSDVDELKNRIIG